MRKCRATAPAKSANGLLSFQLFSITLSQQKAGRPAASLFYDFFDSSRQRLHPSRFAPRQTQRAAEHGSPAARSVRDRRRVKRANKWGGRESNPHVLANSGFSCHYSF